MNIAFYISSHGYGHAARQQAVIRELAQRGARAFVRTAAPRKFFGAAINYHDQRYDIGMIMHDALTFDVAASLRWMADFLREQDALIAAEIAFVREQQIQLIVSDMPPIACEIAAAAGIPSAVVTHFTWDWVYAHYTNSYPQYAYLVDALSKSYHKATLALQMQIPIPHPFEMFPKIEPVGLIYNAVTQSRDAVRAAFDVPDGAKMVLLSMGGHAWDAGNISQLAALENCVFLVMPGLWDQVKHQPQQFRRVPMDTDDYHNLIAAADVVVGKAGGSTVAEAIGHRTPMLYTTTTNWRESALLSRTLERYGVAQHIPMDAFLRGDWVEALRGLLAREHLWPTINRQGASQAADRLLRLAQDGT